MRRRATVLAALLPLCLGGALAAPPGPRAYATAEPRTQLIGASALQALLAAHRGEVLIINVWATFCAPCLREIPTLVELAAALRPRGVRLIGLAMDEPSSLDSQVEPFRLKYFPTFASYLRDESDMDALVSVIDPAWNEILPTTYLIGRDGRMVTRVQGSRTAEEIGRLLEPLL